MMLLHGLMEYALFLAKVVTGVLAIIAVLLAISGVSRRQRTPEGSLELKHLNGKFRQFRLQLQEQLLSGKALKKLYKDEKKADKAKEAAHTADQAKVFVLRFEGDLRASAVAHLREEITALLQVARPEQDRVVLCLESPGGMVHGYGLAASQLQRLRQARLNLVVCVDKVAASGGYMMAALGDRIVAAPFAIVGSIGVVAQLPNINRLLKRHDIDIELHTAGAYKRTLTLLGENTEAGRRKFQEELEDTHVLFKEFVHEARPQVDVERVATGEHWYGQRALALGLIDEISTSDDYLSRQCEHAEVYELSFNLPQPWLQRLTGSLSAGMQQGLEKLLSIRFIA